MAKVKKAVETVSLIAPSGTRVTVAKSAAEKYKRRGYKGVPGRPAKSAEPRSAGQ